MADVRSCVENNNKKRFELINDPQSPNEYLIRAVQGHTIKSVKDEELLTKLSLDIEDKEKSIYKYNTACHGTYSKVLDLIQQNGLCRMARNSIHFAPGVPGFDTVISGMRFSCEIVIEANINQSAFDELPWFVS